MIVPDFWAEARRRHRSKGKQITVRRFGWSEESAEEAERMASERADDALARLVQGEPLARREPKVPYNGAEGVPIREEVLARIGEQVITRNAYGAHCLNSPNSLFVDVDFEPRFRPIGVIRTLLALWTVSAIAGYGVGRWSVAIVLAVVSLFAAVPITHLLVRTWIKWRGGPEMIARRKVASFVAAHPRWNVRIYRTPAGLRLLATHQSFDAHDPEVETFFRAVDADPIYARMCRNQRCFRARLTAKPWRMGIDTHMRPRPGVWPVHPDRVEVRERWIRQYESRHPSFAACHFVESIGSSVIDPSLREVIELHDGECRARDTHLPLA